MMKATRVGGMFIPSQQCDEPEDVLCYYHKAKMEDVENYANVRVIVRVSGTLYHVCQVERIDLMDSTMWRVSLIDYPGKTVLLTDADTIWMEVA